MSSPSSHVPETHWHTSQKKRVQTLHGDADMSYGRIAQRTQIFKITAWRLDQDIIARRIANERQETRGRKRKMTREDVARCDQLLESAGFEGKSLDWESLVHECNLNVFAWILQREMQQLNWHKCVVCKKGWCSSNHAAKRVDWAEEVLFLRFRPED